MTFSKVNVVPLNHVWYRNVVLMAPLRNIIRRFKRNPRTTFPATYFGDGALYCSNCQLVSKRNDLTPLEVIHCPKCNTPMLVPLPLDDFLLFEPIGSGGLASVYKAYHRDAGETVYAVKVLKKQHMSTPDFIHDFIHESDMHGRVAPHPHVVDFITSGHVNTYHYHVMELIEGTSLRSRIKLSGKLDEQIALPILLQVLEGLIHIHRHGVLYRDLNVGNILVDHRGDAVLIDFGLSLLVEEANQRHEKPSHIDGTMEFIPPERLYGEPEDQRSLMYSLGLVMFYVLTAESFIKGSDLKSTAAKHISSLRLAHAPSLPEDVSEHTIALVEAMVQPDPKNRPATLEEAHTTMTASYETLIG